MRVRFVIMKVVGALSTLAFVVVFNFFLFRVVNENTVESMFRGRNLSDSQIARLERQFNLDGSRWDQFTAYVGQLLHGNLGLSMKDFRPVTTVIGEVLSGNTFLTQSS